MTYEDIESGFPTVDQLLDIPVEESGEPLVKVTDVDPLVLSFHNSADMIPLVGEVMYLRKQVFERLLGAGHELKAIQSDLRLKVFYAYRALEVQQRYFEAIIQKMKKQYPDADAVYWRNMAHNLIAFPEVAGHPTGGAVDTTITNIRTSQDLDMGVGVRREEYVEAGRRIYTFSPEIDQVALTNRTLLREVMQHAGFVPFDGEFWHFSYGDREWAHQTGATNAIYSQVLVGELSARLES